MTSSNHKRSIQETSEGRELSDPPMKADVATVPKMTVVVKGKDKLGRAWSDTAEVTSLSKDGVGFFVSRACATGRLISLILPMPPQMRSYDQDKRLYRVWGLVQYCYESRGKDSAGFHIGAALIGKDPPESYANRPNQSYRVCGKDRNGFWKLEELDRSFVKRRSVRYWNSIPATMYKLDYLQRTLAVENTVTENVSQTGASVISDLRVSIGDQIKFQTSSPPFSSLSVVRDRRIGTDDRKRIHLEFIENAFPILEIETPIEEDGEH